MTTNPCIECGKEGHPISVGFTDGPDVACGVMCDECRAEAMSEFRELQRQFAELVDAGVSNADANRIMIARMDHEVEVD